MRSILGRAPLARDASETVAVALATNQGSRTGTLRTAVYAAATAGMLIYAGQGVWAGARLAGYVWGVLFPGAALLTEIGVLGRLPAAMRAITGLLLAMLLATPAFFVRRALPIEGWMADLILVGALCLGAYFRGAYRRFLNDISGPLFRASAPFLFLALPALFILTWMGYEVREGAQFAYYGLFPIDFANLTSVVGLINASPGLPQSILAGSGALSYHWLFFAFPAWLGSFGGGHTADAISLAACNYAAACLLFLTIALAADRGLQVMDADRPVAPSTAALAAGVVTFASLVVYPYQILVRMAVQVTHIPWLAIGVRNGLLLSVPNSMTVFGNNTMAVAMALLVAMMLLEWNRRMEKGYLYLGGALLATIMGYSITLFFPMALTLGIWLLLGRVRKWPIAALCAGIASGCVVAVMYFGLHLFGGGQGLAVAFDKGAYLRQIAFLLLPLWILAWMSRPLWRKLSLFWTLIICGVVVPSLLYIPHSVTGPVDFSMKIATLIAAASAPLVCAGLERCRRDWRAPAAVAAATLMAVGLACTAAYAGQFAYARLSHDHTRVLSLPSDYVSALTYIRDHSSAEAIVIDPQSIPFPLSIPTVSIGERRVYLPTKYSEDVSPPAAALAEEMTRRTRDFQEWAQGGFRDGRLSARLASAADYCLVAGPAPANGDWVLVQRFGDYSIWQSKVRLRS